MRLKDLLEVTNINLSKESYTRFSDYISEGKIINNKVDLSFEEKIQKIYDLIINEKVTDLKFIAKDSGCATLEECVLKIRYLENKRIIENYYIDRVTWQIKKCSLEDEKLLEKYSGYIYNMHLQIDEITLKLPHVTVNNFKEQREKVYQDILYLYDKYLLNGIKLNKVDRYISYYTIDKKKQQLELITIKCPNCGADCHLNRYSKVRCEYCDSIIEDKIENYM